MIYALLLIIGAIFVAPGLGGYNITVVTAPRKGPFRLLTSVTLSCQVNPQPPGRVFYSWKSSYPRSGLSSDNSTSPNTTFSISYEQLSFGWYFCYVYSDGTLVGVGRTLVETKGYILTDWPHTQFFTPGETVGLRVNISTISSGIARLAWFHNGREITTNCGRFTVNARGTELTIRNATSSDGGRYTVRTSALRYNMREDPLWIPLLEHYAPLTPVTYTLTEQGKSVPDLEVTSRLDYHYVHLPGQFMIQKYFESSLIPLVNNIQIRWYHNGTAVDAFRTNSSLESQGERLTLSLTVFNASEEMDLGLYEGVVTVNCGGGQPGNYICRDIGFYQLQLVAFPVVILQYEPPSTSVTAEQPALEGRESTILTCSAHGGRPDTHNLTWTKDGVVLARGSGTTLNYSTLSSFPNPFGRYVCSVESLYSNQEKSVLIKEKVSLQIKIALGMQCDRWKHRRTISHSVTTIIQDLCHCNITTDSLQDSSLKCSQTGDSTVFTSSLVYSSDNGSLTASMLVDMLQTWLLTSDNTSTTLTTVDESLVEFSRTCPTRLTPQTTGACTRPLSPWVEGEQPTRVSNTADTGGTQPTGTHASVTGGTQPTGTHASDTSGTQPTGTHASDTSGTQPTGTHASDTGGTQPTGTHASHTGETQPTETHAFGVASIASTAGAFGGGLLLGIAIFGAVIGVGLCILRWRADPVRHTFGGQLGEVGMNGLKGKEEFEGKNELELQQNAAYAPMHYIEDPVYEDPS